MFHLHRGVTVAVGWVVRYFYLEPLFRGRCASVGKRFHLSRLPFIVGHAQIHIGDDVTVRYFTTRNAPSGSGRNVSRRYIGTDVTVRYFTPIARIRN